MADLEGAAGAEAFASGMAAISAIFLGLCRSGDRLVAARQLYGGTHDLLTNILPRYGIEAEMFDVDDFDGIESSLEGAKLLYCETIGNPRITVADLPKLRADRPRSQGSPGRRQHLCQSGPVSAHRTRCRHLGAQRHQVPRRAP